MNTPPEETPNSISPQDLLLNAFNYFGKQKLSLADLIMV